MRDILKAASAPAAGFYRVFLVHAPAGFRAMTEEGELIRTNLIVLAGNISRWLYIWAMAKLEVAALQPTAVRAMFFDPFSLILDTIVPRAVISLILSIIVTAATWKWLRKTFTPAHIKWVAFFLGFWAEPTVGLLGILLKLLITDAWPT